MGDQQTEATRAHVLALYADYARGDMPAVMAGLAEDVVWQSLGENFAPWCGRRLGHQAVADYFAAVTSVCAMTGYEIERVIVDGQWATVVCTLHVRFHADGSAAAYDKIDILRVADGRVVEFREFYDTARLSGELGRLNAMGSGRATP